ncbi:hypothetical protein MCOR25_003712 [Pyricularia grisea]|uniref:Uncharacterized protein n=1 Tax=Pyricularia grisea TaxID=148305 RepID=A0A6P8B331_PYRGI|nr:uncharacterized protein PgNI_07978 [Pyricularia grisea]KAI6372553.1 hypothetical protein MCOR25_003712 [Pyricularia grisea]TLD09214.1 hypothetical protein PgNI_07978 [Pyricularia grisea]
MRVNTAFTALVGVSTQLASTAPTQPLVMNRTIIPPCHQESERCRVIGPGPRFSLTFMSTHGLDVQRQAIESACGVATESWDVETPHVPPGGEDFGCIPVIVTFNLANFTGEDPKVCVASGLRGPFPSAICVE